MMKQEPMKFYWGSMFMEIKKPTGWDFDWVVHAYHQKTGKRFCHWTFEEMPTHAQVDTMWFQFWRFMGAM